MPFEHEQGLPVGRIPDPDRPVFPRRREPSVGAEPEAVYITEFGRSVKLIDAPGLHWKWPYQSRRGFDKRLQLDAPPPREMLTRDKKNLEVAWYASWRIADVEKFLHAVRTIPDASARLEDMAASVLAAELGGHDLAELVAVGRESAIDALMNCGPQAATLISSSQTCPHA